VCRVGKVYIVAHAFELPTLYVNIGYLNNPSRRNWSMKIKEEKEEKDNYC
jgi:hypothetical protein